MDRWWVANVLFHPREKDGNLKVSDKPVAKKDMTLKEKYFAWYKTFDWPDWRIDQAWAEAEAHKAKLAAGKR